MQLATRLGTINVQPLLLKSNTLGQKIQVIESAVVAVENNGDSWNDGKTPGILHSHSTRLPLYFVRPSTFARPIPSSAPLPSFVRPRPSTTSPHTCREIFGRVSNPHPISRQKFKTHYKWVRMANTREHRSEISSNTLCRQNIRSREITSCVNGGWLLVH